MNTMTDYDAGWTKWNELYEVETLEYPLDHPRADSREFRRGFDAAARADGHTYSRVSGDYVPGGEFENDDLEPTC